MTAPAHDLIMPPARAKWLELVLQTSPTRSGRPHEAHRVIPRLVSPGGGCPVQGFDLKASRRLSAVCNARLSPESRTNGNTARCKHELPI